MALDPQHPAEAFRLPPVAEIIRDNILKYGNPLGFKGRETAAWAKGLDLPRQGPVLFYTGGEYQLLPYIDALLDLLTKVNQEGVGFSLMLGVRQWMDRLGVNPEKLVAKARSRDKDRYFEVVRKAALLLRQAGVEICYLGEEEIYSGALLYEYGFVADLARYAARLVELIRSTGARTIVCLSPHAAEVLKLVYPRLLGDFAYEVKVLAEVLVERGEFLPPPKDSGFSGPVTVQDPCRLARELGVAEELRTLIRRFSRARLVEPKLSRRWTTCCGGPGKVLFPKLSAKIAFRRLAELADTGAKVVLTFCPYCLAALQYGRNAEYSGLRIEDFTEFLYREVTL